MKKLYFFIFLMISFILHSCDVSHSNNQREDEDEEEISETIDSSQEDADKFAIKVEKQLKDLSERINTIHRDIEKWLGSVEEKAIAGDPLEPQQITGKINSFKEKLEKSSRELINIDEMISDDESLKEAYSRESNEISSQIDALYESLNKFEEQYIAAYEKPKIENEEIKRQIETRAESIARVAEQGKTCYYIVASKKDLKEHKLNEKQFLKKSSLSNNSPETQFFQQSGINNLRTIKLNGKKAKILTSQSKSSSYLISKNGDGTMSLEILDPDEFWKGQNFLVIQIE